MIQCGGVWLPDGEVHLVDWMTTRQEYVDGKLTYQLRKIRHALTLTSRRECAIDVGAHCGLWSMHLAREFDVVHAFEPVREHVECLMRNVPNENVHVHEYALGEKDGSTSMHTEPTSSGDTYPDPRSKNGGTIVRKFDDLSIDAGVSLVKLDCEGYELFALRGMQGMLERDRPAVVVEQKPGKAQKYGLGETQAVEFLRAMHYTVDREIGGDYFLLPVA